MVGTTYWREGRVSAKNIKKTLKNFGLTEKEAEIYIILAKHGILTGGQISKLTKMQRPHVYRILKSLKKKRVVDSTLEAPTRFSSVPFEKILDENIKIKQEEAIILEETKKGSVVLRPGFEQRSTIQEAIILNLTKHQSNKHHIFIHLCFP